jgi:phage terminase small subunit
MRKLTPKQQRFVDEYLIDLNASGAAKRAGYSAKTADQLGYQLLQHPSVADAISKGRQSQTTRAKVDAQWLLDRLTDICDADLADLYDEKGALKPIQQWPKIFRTGLVAGIETEQQFEMIDGKKVPTGVLHKIKLSDRAKREELIGRHRRVGAWVDKHEHSGPDGKPIEVVEIPETERARRIAFLLSKATRETVQ